MFLGKSTSILLCALLGLALALAATAQAAPSNDNFESAIPIAAGEQVTGTNLNATSEGLGEPNVASAATAGSCVTITENDPCASSVWFSFQAPETAEYTFETCDGGTDLDSVLGAYTGSTLISLTQVIANDDGAGNDCAGGYEDNGSRISFNATSGTVYHLDLGGYRADEGSFYLRGYTGGPRPRPEPETIIERDGSYADAAETQDAGNGMVSGFRHTSSFILRSSPPGASFECSVDGGAFASCEALVSLDQLAPGPHTFAARASLSGATDPTPVVERFEVDTSPPNTFLELGPLSPATDPVTWMAGSSERLNLTERFLCGVDSQPTAPCGPTNTFSNLCTGTHTFRSASFDKASNLDPDPLTTEVEVESGSEPCAFPGLGTPSASEVESTKATVNAATVPRGSGGDLRIEYGPTSSYGTTVRRSVAPETGVVEIHAFIHYLLPETTYHYLVTMTTPLGENSSADQTFTTGPVVDGLPVIQNGTPTIAGGHAATVPFTVDTKGVETHFDLLISKASPVTVESPRLETEVETVPAGSSPSPVAIPIADLDPGVTYHYRVGVEQLDGAENSVLGPEGTFTPELSHVSVTQKAHFKLGRKNVKLGKLGRGSKIFKVRIQGLPAGTRATLRLAVGKGHQKAVKKATSKGLAKFKLKLTKKVRKALHDKTVKRARVQVSVAPPGDTGSKITLKKKLRP